MKGLVQDKAIQTFGEGEYFYAKNIVLDDKTNSVANEEGNLLHSNIGNGKTIIGQLSVLDSSVIFWVAGSTSGIGLLKEDIYQDLADPNNVISGIGFNVLFPIKAEYFIKNNGEVIVAFVADNIKPRVINIGTLINPVITDADDNKDILMFPEAEVSPFTSTISAVGGSLLSGVYYMVYAYKNNDTVTNYYNIGNPISISDDNDGIESGIVTNKSIQVSFTDLDTAYQYVRIGYIYKDSLSIKAFVVGDYVINGSTLTVNITGIEVSEEVLVEELTVPNIQYTRAKDLTVLNDRLYLGNLKVRDDIDYQQYANDILIDYNYTLKTINDTTKLEQSNRDNTGFLHSEVYAFYIRFWLNDGSVSKWFHIPGREYVVGDDTGGDITVGTLGTKSRWYYMSNFDVAGAATNMGYYENADETYPDNTFPTTGDSAGGNKVRHHRFPSMKHIRTVSGDADYGVTKMSVLGIDVSNVTNIPADATHWEIGYAKRDYSNATNYACGITNYAAFPKDTGAGQYWIDNTVVWSSGVNFNILEGADNNTDRDRWAIDYNYGTSGVFDVTGATYTYVRFNTLDTLLNTPVLSNPYVHIEYFLSRDLTSGSDTARWQLFSSTANNPSGNNYDRRRVVIDYTLGTCTDLTDDKFVEIVNYEYLETNSIGAGNGSVEYYNIDNEATLLLEGQVDIVEDVDATPVPTMSGTSNVLSTGNGLNYQFTSNAFLITLKSTRNNCYQGFQNQIVVSTGKLNTGSTGSMKGGDAFLCDYSFITTAETAPFNTNGGTPSGIRAVHRYLTESSINGNLRYEINTNYYSKYHPKSDYRNTDELFDLGANYPLGIEPNQIAYNKENNSLNDLKQTIVNFPDRNYETVFPYRVARSEIQSREGDIINWKIWKSQDYYESVRDRGEITAIKGYLPKFLIHHERGLFVTKDRVKLPTNEGEVQVGAGDIFELDPVELITTEGGFAGTQNKIATDLNKLGYCFIDVLQGKVFIYNGDNLNEISNTGLRNFFRDYLPMWQTVITNSTTNVTGTYNAKKNITTIPKYIIDVTLDGKVITDVIPPANYLNGDEVYYREGDYSGSISVNTKVRTQKKEKGDNPYYGLGYSICYDEKWNRLILNKIRECYFTTGVEGIITRSKITNTITQTLYTNTATKTGTGNNNIIGISADYYYADDGMGGIELYTLLALTFEFEHGLSISDPITIAGGTLAGNYTVDSVLNTFTISLNLAYYVSPVIPYGYVSQSITEYWNGSAWQSTPTTWVTYGAAASAISGASTQSNDGGVLHYFNQSGVWQSGSTTYITYNTSAQAQGVAGTGYGTPSYTVNSTTTEYWNGSQWTTTPTTGTYSITKDCTIPYITEIISGKLITGDFKFQSKLQNGEFILDSSNNYKIWNNGEEISISNSDSWTVSYSPKSNMWVSFHSYKPKRIFSTYNKLWSIDNNLIYLHNLPNVTVYNGTSTSAFIDVVFNFGKKVLFTGLSWNTTVEELSNIVKYNDTIDYITIRTDNQITKRIEIEPLVNTRRVYDEWYYNGVRDSNEYNKKIIKDILNEYEVINTKDKRSYNRGRFITDAIICRLEITGENKVYIHSVSPIVKPIYR